MRESVPPEIDRISRRFFARAGLLPLLGGISGCSSAGGGEDAPNAGALLLSISAARHLHFAGYSFLYKKKADAPSLFRHDFNRFSYFEEGLNTKRDFEDDLQTGVVRYKRFAPGEYDIFWFHVPRGAPFANIYFQPTKPFSIPFTIRPYETTYIGNFDAHEIPGGRTLGFPAASGVYFVLSDQGSRDISIAQKQSAIIGAVRKDVPDPALLGTPLFRKS